MGTPNYKAGVIKRNHQQLQHVINRILSRLGVPDKAARGIAGIHGMLNGRSDLPVFKAHKYTARQLNFRGDDESAKKFMCRVLDAIRDAQHKCGRRFFAITRADDVTQKMTSYDDDFIGEAALWALLEAQSTPDWTKNPTKAITDELIDRAVEMLPPCEIGEKGQAGLGLTDEEIIRGIWTKIENLAAKNFERIVAAGGDPAREVRRIQDRLGRLAISARKQMTKRDRAARLTIIEQDESGRDSGNNVPLRQKAEPTLFDEPEGGQTVPPNQVLLRDGSSYDGDNLGAALGWAKQGIPVIPLYGVADGICDCREGSECRSAGKHPLSRLVPRGVKNASTDPEKIRNWWGAAPLANVGIVMGGPLRFLALDVDPRSGGDASLYDLVEVRGDKWLKTLTVKTGGLGSHLIFTMPAGVKVSRAKLAPGIDLKTEGGYLVAAPSIHTSGRRYEVVDSTYPAEAPEWLVGELMSAPGVEPSKIVDFQERRSGRTTDVHILEGERNDTLFRIGCALWGSGEVQDLPTLNERLLEENSERCTPPLADAEVVKISTSITARYSPMSKGHKGEAA
jgi:hypothetical protein